MARRRARTSFAMRVRTWWVLATLVAFACAGCAVAFAEAPQLRVRAVAADVPLGAPVRPADVLAAAAVPADANLWLLDTGAMRRRVAAIPYVDDVRIRRAQFPQPNLTIAVTLRRPNGCVRTGGTMVTIDANARVLQRGCATPTLPHVDGGDAAPVAPGDTLAAPDLERLLTDAKTILDRLAVREVRRDRWGGVEAIDIDGVTLRFGADGDLAAKLALVEPIRRSVGNGRKLTAIDLRAPDTPVVEFP
jgi:cell division septal protein FtsQ